MNHVFLHDAVLVLRSFLPMLGIVCVNMILFGAFNVMICSGNLDAEHHAMHTITTGVIGSVVIACLFAATTVTLGRV